MLFSSCVVANCLEFNPFIKHTLPSNELSSLLNFGIDEPSSVIGAQSWLFHDYKEEPTKGDTGGLAKGR